MNRDDIKKENKKALKVFIPVMLLCAAFGGVFGYYTAMAGVDEVAEKIEAWLQNGLYVLSPYLVVAVVTAALLVSYLQYRKAKQLFRNFDEDEDDDDLYIQADRKIAVSVAVSGIGLIVGMMFFAVVIGNLEAYVTEHFALSVTTIAVFVIGNFLTIRLQQLQIDFYKQMAPSMKGSVYDMKFHQKWEESCDEAEKMVIYKASYRAFRTGNIACSIGWIIAAMGTMMFSYGSLPAITISVIWLIMDISYYKEVMRLEKGKINK